MINPVCLKCQKEFNIGFMCPVCREKEIALLRKDSVRLGELLINGWIKADIRPFKGSGHNPFAHSGIYLKTRILHNREQIDEQIALKDKEGIEE